MASLAAVSNALRSLGDRYEILSPLGRGAAANVFRVRDARTGAERAAKVLRPDNARNADILARFEDEFRILRTLHHPHLPGVFDYGRTEDGARHLVMELVDGEPLDRYFAAHPEDIWVILYEICETLVFVHGRNLLHQDIKPSNILVSRVAAPDGERPMVKLIDFGLTYRRGTGAAVKLVGTAEYIAPEVVRGEATLTRAVDYYSLGVTLFELLAGAPPFTGSESEVLRAHLEREAVFEDEALEWAELYPHVRALLAKDPKVRLVAFEEFRRAVAGRLTGGIEDLDRSYALARIDSLGMIGKRDAWDGLLGWLGAIGGPDVASVAHTVTVSGGEGTGKRYLMSALRAEAAVRGIRTLTPAEIDTARSDATVARQPALMWSRLLEVCEREPVMLVVGRPTTLPDEERSFVRLAGTQWELARSHGRVLPLFFLVAIDPTSEDADVLDYLPAENALKLELGALIDAEREQIVSQFRGSMFDSRDARALATYLGRFEDTGGAIQGLQQAVLRSALTFAGQRWKVQPSLLTEMVTTRADESFSRDLVASLSPVEQQIAAVVAAHPEPVPLSWVADFSGVSPEMVLSIIRGPLKRLCVVSSEKLSPASATIRAVLRTGCDRAEMRRAHEFLAARVATADRGVSTDRALAYHYEQLGAVRDAARVHLRLLQAYWSVRPRERPYELIEGVCRNGLELLEAHGGTVTPPARRHLFCFYLKQWIKALWARNLFTHAKPIIDEWTIRLGETTPASVAPRYVRSVLELEGPEEALSVHLRLVPETRLHSQLAVRLLLERALILNHRGDYTESLDCLDSIDVSVLEDRDKFRHQIYRAMSLDELHGMGAIQSLIDSLVGPATRAGCIDEAVLVHALRARSSIAAGQPATALRDIAIGIRLAHRSGLQFRENLLFRLAAAVYGDTNDLFRVHRSQARALEVAGVIGIRYIIGTSWARLASNECFLGRFGNALRYSERAIGLMSDGAPNRDRHQAYIAFYTALVFSRMTDDSRAHSIIRKARSSKGYNERGYYDMLHGRDLLVKMRLKESLESFKSARKNFDAAGFPANSLWARLGEARVHLAHGDQNRFLETIGHARMLMYDNAPHLYRLEFWIVTLKGHYLFRSARSVTLRVATQSEQMIANIANVPLKLEMLEVLVRTYARMGAAADVERVFLEYRSLVGKVVANAESKYASAIAQQFSLGELIAEYQMAVGRNTEGGPLSVPLYTD